ncbi:Sn1-specific diacylglycerol lipase beta [Porphyridium purpureum]|uniref:sn-1-specific diacylglycerol lipase n=1 Tax=Porphyridium purpureum TaxID=35688 RepID=A0A5J4Z482_PORPP|nr:Sn1-specific diacylglycerol lipase beta [Porphyridium purpureum]|eukprot:POR3805..scf295_1
MTVLSVLGCERMAREVGWASCTDGAMMRQARAMCAHGLCDSGRQTSRMSCALARKWSSSSGRGGNEAHSVATRADSLAESSSSPDKKVAAKKERGWSSVLRSWLGLEPGRAESTQSPQSASSNKSRALSDVLRFDTISMDAVSVDGLTIAQWKAAFRHLVPPEKLPSVKTAHMLSLSALVLADSFVTPLASTVREEKMIGPQTTFAHGEKDVLRDGLYYGHLSRLVYRPLDAILLDSYLKLENVVRHNASTLFDHTRHVFMPGFLVAIDEETSSIIVLVRGTKEPQDALIDICGTPRPVSFLGNDREYMIHGAIGDTALALFHDLKTDLVKLTKEYPDFPITFVGHSLGGAVCAALSLYVAHDDELGHVKRRTFSFNAPPTISRELALVTRSEEEMYSFVNGMDAVSRVSIPSIIVTLKALERYYAEMDIRGLIREFWAAQPKRETIPSDQTPGEKAFTVREHSANSAGNAVVQNHAATTQDRFVEIMAEETQSSSSVMHGPDQLYLPGRVVHVTSQAQGSNTRYQALIRDAFDDEFCVIPISGRMIRDHMMREFLPCLRGAYKYATNARHRS